MIASGESKNLEVLPLAIPEVKLIVPRRHTDARGFFAEVFSRRSLAAAGIDFDGVQDNQSFSRDKGTVRGLHFQLRPFAQAKLIRVARGSILDVAVDIRAGSPTFRKHVSFVLRADSAEQLYVPAGFAHGFCTLEPDTEVLYKVDAYYSAAHDRGIIWNDPDLAIAWPVSSAEVQLSDKDQKLPRLKDIEPMFSYANQTPGQAGISERSR